MGADIAGNLTHTHKRHVYVSGMCSDMCADMWPETDKGTENVCRDVVGVYEAVTSRVEQP